MARFLTVGTRTEKYDRIEKALKASLADFVTSRRRDGLSWRKIANALTALTGEDITGEALRMWFQGRQPVAPERAA